MDAAVYTIPLTVKQRVSIFAALYINYTCVCVCVLWDASTAVYVYYIPVYRPVYMQCVFVFSVCVFVAIILLSQLPPAQERGFNLLECLTFIFQLSFSTLGKVGRLL